MIGGEKQPPPLPERALLLSTDVSDATAFRPGIDRARRNPMLKAQLLRAAIGDPP